MLHISFLLSSGKQKSSYFYFLYNNHNIPLLYTYIKIYLFKYENKKKVFCEFLFTHTLLTKVSLIRKLLREVNIEYVKLKK